MSRPPQKERDEIIYKLHKGNKAEKPKSFGEMAKMFKVSKVAIFEAYWKVAVTKGEDPPKCLKHFKEKYR